MARQQKLNDHVREQAMQSVRDKTAEAFYNEKRNGFTLSERVWNLSRNAKKEIEIILQNGIKEGKSATEISKSLKGYLNEPERLFRRERNKETGELELKQSGTKISPWASCISQCIQKCDAVGTNRDKRGISRGTMECGIKQSFDCGVENSLVKQSYDFDKRKTRSIQGYL